jgi:hypothetical protein
MTFSKKIEDEINYLVNDVEREYPYSRNDAIKDLMQDCDDNETIAWDFRKELNAFAIKIGVYKEMTQWDLDNTIVTRGKVYDLKVNKKFYKFDSWLPLEGYFNGQK